MRSTALEDAVSESTALTLPPVRHHRTWWASLLTLAGPGTVTVQHGAWHLVSRNAVTTVSAEEVSTVTARRGLFWSTLVLQTTARTHRFGGLRPSDAEALVRGYHQQTLGAPIRRALADWERVLDRPRYLNHFAWSRWQAQTAPLLRRVRSLAPATLHPSIRAEAERFSATHRDLLDRVRVHNATHVARELQACASFFDGVEANPLTPRQREAILTDEDNTLVVAGAGTGKTSVVVSKVGYLVRRLGLPPAQILLLAYNRSAREEIEERLAERVGVTVEAYTFHALGYHIIGVATGRRPTVHRLATDDRALGQFIDARLRAMLADSVARVPLLRHLVEHLRPYKAPGDFETRGEYYGWLKGADIRTLRNEQVKSYEECVIADWLFVHGIAYTYEAPYEVDTATSQHRQYAPDFTLHPQQGRSEPVYIEHWGIDRQGGTAPTVDRDRYRQRMAWAEATHRAHGSTLVQTFSYDRAEGQLVERLEARLRDVGIRPQQRPAHELETAADRRGVLTRLAKLLGTFLKHFKAGNHTVASLRQSGRAGEPARRDSFLDVFSRIYAAYQRRLQEDRSIDYIDMIGRATEAVRDGRFRSGWRYVIVDEFQDIAPHRARLLQALLGQVEDRRLTCVGDDWQSIYRFAGADISLMTSFESHFGYTATVLLDRTFRFGDKLLKASATFIQENPAQLRKALSAGHVEANPPVVVVPCAPRPYGDQAAAIRLAVDELRAVLRRIATDAPRGARPSVMLLGRYRHDQPPCSQADLLRGLPPLDLEFRTVHRAKGLQADYVVVLRVTAGRYGFPSEVTDDPLLGMVLAQPDEHAHAEERRLFYVALTRARRKVFLLTMESKPSPFIEELAQPAYRGWVELPGAWATPVPCAECGAHLTRRVNRNTGGTFWGCVHYPYCNGSMEVCASCQDGALVRQGVVFQCNNPACDASAEVCPRCGEGMLHRKQNRKDQSYFWSCSRWRPDGSGCRYTRNAGAPRKPPGRNRRG